MTAKLVQAMPEIDPTPTTREGAQAMVERFYALKNKGTEVWGAGVPISPRATSPNPVTDAKNKKNFNFKKISSTQKIEKELDATFHSTGMPSYSPWRKGRDR